MKKLMVIAAVLVLFTGSAIAADWEFYGSARVSTFYSNIDNTPFAATTGTDTENFEMDLNGNARIGANVKVSDSLTARFEYGAKSGNVNMRILWGEWNFGAGSLGIGQHYTPLLMPYSNQVYNIYAREDGDTNMSLFGMLYGGRKPMIRLKFGTFQIAAVETDTTVQSHLIWNGTFPPTPGVDITYADAGPDTEVKIPSIQAKYRLDFGMGHLNFAGGYQTFDVMSGGMDYEVESYLAAIGGRLNFGGFYLKGNVWGGQNVGNMADILVSRKIFSTMAATVPGADLDGAGLGFARWSDGTYNALDPTQPEIGITDNDAFAGLAVLGYEIRKGLYLEAGYGYTKTELDEEGSEKDEAHTYYLQSTIFLAEGVFLTPEVGVVDGVEEGDTEMFYGGIKWQINF